MKISYGAEVGGSISANSCKLMDCKKAEVGEEIRSLKYPQEPFPLFLIQLSTAAGKLSAVEERSLFYLPGHLHKPALRPVGPSDETVLPFMVGQV